MPLYNDEMLVKVVLKHYQSASRIIFFDMGSTDDGPKIAISGNREVIFVENKFDDLINIKIKNEAWKDLASNNDYVIVQDTDELIFFQIVLMILFPNYMTGSATLYPTVA